MSTINDITIVNATGAVLKNAVISTTGTKGLYKIKRTFAAIDVGTDLGKTRDNTDPTVGCLVAQFRGGKYITITGARVFRPTVAATTVFDVPIADTANGFHKLGYRTSLGTDGILSLYVFDYGGHADVRIIENDYLQLLVEVGN